MKPVFLKTTSGHLIPTTEVVCVDASEVSNLKIIMYTDTGMYVAEGLDCIDAVMCLRPSLFEGVRLKFPKNAWIVHNLIAHPVMQILALIGLPKLGIRFHDSTIPRPKDTKK